MNSLFNFLKEKKKILRTINLKVVFPISIFFPEMKVNIKMSTCKMSKIKGIPYSLDQMLQLLNFSTAAKGNHKFEFLVFQPF